MSESSDHEPGVRHYNSTTNTKGKQCTKLRRCVKCNKVSIAYYDCYNKTFCYVVGEKKHGQTCIINHIKEMKCAKGRKHLRSNRV